jgi:hypothetical protein
MRAPAFHRIAFMCAAMIAGAGCVEERIVQNRPMLSGLPGAVTGRPVTGPAGAIDPKTVPDDKIVVENKDGTTTLLAKTGRQLMIHIVTTLDNDQRELFVEQVLSEKTRQEFYERGLDPALAFDELQRRRGDIDVVFSRMPAAESSPGVLVKQVEKKTTRVQLTGMAAEKLSWIGFDMTMEKGNWKLRWFIPGRE